VLEILDKTRENNTAVSAIRRAATIGIRVAAALSERHEQMPIVGKADE
jgi:hypothetical protein